MSLTDEIYSELWDGLEKGLDWQRFLAKYSTSKRPLYNAIGRLFTEVGPRIAALNEEWKQVQEKLDQAEPTLDSLNQETREAESNIASLEERKNVLDEQVEA
jgi:chromosome segregation ATPase